jgi:calcium/calmodulin-dependent protein kinase I
MSDRYKVGKTLGQGTYAVVKEAVHIKTGKYYACKVISKRLMEGREHMVRNEIAALKKVSQVSQGSESMGKWKVGSL